MSGKARCCFVPVSTAILLLLAWGPAPGWAQKRPSAKELVQQAEADQKANRWEAAREKLKDAAAQKPKDKKIADALKQTEVYLADSTAVRAIGFCNNHEIDKCEKEAKLAASYADTQRVQEAQTRLAASKKEVQDQWNRVQKMISDGQLAEASLELENLNRFSYLIPTLNSEKERVKTLRITTAIDAGRNQMGVQRWDAAIESFTAALRLDAGNKDAARLLESARLEKEAATSFQQAQNAYQAKSYQIAYEATQKAKKIFGGRAPYLEVESKIGADWSKVLIEEARKLSANVDSLKDNQKAFEDLEMVRRLDSRNAALAEEMGAVKTALHSMYIQKAGDYQAVADNSRIGLSYLYYLNAQMTNPGGEFAFGARLREAASTFARKRTVQVLVNVDNLSPAPSNFADVVTKRVRSVIEKLSLPDLKLRTVDDYQKNTGEDPQFVELRPDGKSPTVLVLATINNHESENTGGDKPIDKQSKYVAGQESIPNPAYADIEAKYRKVAASVLRDKPKPGKATKDGFTLEDQQIYREQMTNTPREIVKDKISGYTYQEFQLKVRALVQMNLEVRDYLEKQLLASDTIAASDEKSQVEISGVRDRDVNNLMNRSAKLPPADQLARECERKSLEQVDEKTRALIGQYLQRFYMEGEKALRENRLEDAVENFICHWYLMRGRTDDKQTQRIRDAVKLATGLDITAASVAPAM